MEKAEREMRKKQHQKNPSIESRSQVHGITTIVTLPWRHQIFAIIVVMFLIFMSVSTISIPGFSRAFDDTEDGGNDTGGNVWDRIGYQDDDTIEKITDPGAENEEHSNTGNPEDNWDTGYVNCKSKRNGEENENENGLTVDEWTIQDPDHDDLFDFLSVNITFSKPASANMRIIWNLESSNPEAAGQNVMGITDLSKDQENISLILPGADIYIREINGPFHLSLELIEEDSTINSTSVILNEELSYRAFESPFPCGFLANIEHKGIDTDGDQLYDHLEINTTVFTRDVGNYTIMGELVDQATYRSRKDPSGDKPSSKGEPGYSGIYFGNDAIASSFHSLLINDTRELNSKAMLRFDGTLINLSNIDGPYYVLAYIFHEGGYVDYRDWMITGYEHQLFQGPSIYATLTGTYFIN